MKKIKWKVSEKETGLAAIAYQRGWPTASYEPGDVTCARVTCEAGYYPADVKTGNHPLLTLRIADWSKEGNSFNWVRAKQKFATLKELKAALPGILKANPYLIPANEEE